MRYSFHVVGHLPHYPFAPLALYWAKRIVQVDPRALRPVDAIGRIAPRPVLVVHGGADPIVPVDHARLLFHAADEPKELWIDPGVGHVGARDRDPDGYVLRVEGFFRQAFADPRLSLAA